MDAPPALLQGAVRWCVNISLRQLWDQGAVHCHAVAPDKSLSLQATASQPFEDAQPELPGCQHQLTVEQASDAMLHLAGTQPLQPAAMAENLHLLVAALEQNQSAGEPDSGQAAADGDSPATARPTKRRRHKAQVCRSTAEGKSTSDERLADSSDEESSGYTLSRPAQQAAKRLANVPKQQVAKQRQSRPRAAKQRRRL